MCFINVKMCSRNVERETTPGAGPEVEVGSQVPHSQTHRHEPGRDDDPTRARARHRRWRRLQGRSLDYGDGPTADRGPARTQATTVHSPDPRSAPWSHRLERAIRVCDARTERRAHASRFSPGTRSDTRASSGRTLVTPHTHTDRPHVAHATHRPLLPRVLRLAGAQ